MTEGCEVKGFAADTAATTTLIRVHSCRFVVNELRRAVNKGTLRAFRNADRFTAFKIFRRPGKLVATLEDPATYTGGGHAVAINRDLSALSHDLARLTAEWESVTATVNAA